jgi:hypothetical protein
MDFDSCGSGRRPVAGSCEQGNEPWASIKCWGFLEWLRNCWKNFVLLDIRQCSPLKVNRQSGSKNKPSKEPARGRYQAELERKEPSLQWDE